MSEGVAVDLLRLLLFFEPVVAVVVVVVLIALGEVFFELLVAAENFFWQKFADQVFQGKLIIINIGVGGVVVAVINVVVVGAIVILVFDRFKATSISRVCLIWFERLVMLYSVLGIYQLEMLQHLRFEPLSNFRLLD